MADPTAIEVSSNATVEDVMAALAKQSIFDLHALAQKVLAVGQEQAQAEDASQADLFIHDTYVIWHSQE